MATNKTSKKNASSARRSPAKKAAAKKISKVISKKSVKITPKTKGKAKVALTPAQIKADAAAAAAKKEKKNPSIMPPDVVKREIEALLANQKANEYLKRNVSKTAIDVLYMLTSPKTDEALAETLGMKINAIRRILNIMQGYGITNYYVSKNTKGWLSFAWYINTTKLSPFLDFVSTADKESAVINSTCNDYFLCNDCYKSDMLVYTFDAAFDTNFKCNCGKSLARMDKTEAETMLSSAPA